MTQIDLVWTERTVTDSPNWYNFNKRKLVMELLYYFFEEECHFEAYVAPMLQMSWRSDLWV